MVTRDQNLKSVNLATESEGTLEHEAGQKGLGGRPSLHPAWSGRTDRRILGETLGGSSRADEEFGLIVEKKERAS